MVIYTSFLRLKYGARGYELMTKDPQEFQKIAGDYFNAMNRISDENAQKEAERIDIGKYFYLMNYGQHYSNFLESSPNKSVAIAELFIFRAWATQLGFRLFSSKPAVSEEIITQVFNQGKLGAAMFSKLENIDIQKILNKDYVTLMDERWQEYDRIFISQKSPEAPISTRQICGRVSDLCGVKDPIKFVWLTTDFVDHLAKIKIEAMQLGIFKV